MGGQQYKAHFDQFDPWRHLRDHDFLSEMTHRRNRFATLFIYLSAVDSGGETGFPRAHGSLGEQENTDCSSWLTVKAKPGRALLFYPLHPDATPNVHSEHAGCPVHSGVKWAATIWFYNGHRRPLPLEADSELMPLLRGVKLLEKNDGPECVDAYEDCATWAEEGRCLDSSGYMASKCMESCGICPPQDDDNDNDDSQDEVLQDDDAGDNDGDELNEDKFNDHEFNEEELNEQNEAIRGIDMEAG